MKIYGDSRSGNRLKVKWICDFLSIPYGWLETDLLAGESRTPAFLALNPGRWIGRVERASHVVEPAGG